MANLRLNYFVTMLLKHVLPNVPELSLGVGDDSFVLFAGGSSSWRLFMFDDFHNTSQSLREKTDFRKVALAV